MFLSERDMEAFPSKVPFGHCLSICILRICLSILFLSVLSSHGFSFHLRPPPRFVLRFYRSTSSVLHLLSIFSLLIFYLSASLWVFRFGFRPFIQGPTSRVSQLSSVPVYSSLTHRFMPSLFCFDL
jgi:hypothetical protein